MSITVDLMTPKRVDGIVLPGMPRRDEWVRWRIRDTEVMGLVEQVTWREGKPPMLQIVPNTVVAVPIKELING